MASSEMTFLYRYFPRERTSTKNHAYICNVLLAEALSEYFSIELPYAKFNFI